jgi:hypothetical protein
MQLKTVPQLAERELDLVKQKCAMQAALAALELEAGASLVDQEPDTAPGALDAVRRMQADLDFLENGLKACQARRLEAVHRDHEARLESLRESAAGPEKELASLKAKFEKHRRALVELAGIDLAIVPAIPGQASRLAQLSAQIGTVGAQIAELERQRVHDYGSVDVDAEDVDEAVLAVLNQPSIVPSAEAVFAWFDDVQGSARRDFGQYYKKFHIVWKGGVIDRDETYVLIEQLGQQVQNQYSAGYHLDLRSAMFKAA